MKIMVNTASGQKLATVARFVRVGSFLYAITECGRKKMVREWDAIYTQDGIITRQDLNK